jgi:hypothetical protein
MSGIRITELEGSEFRAIRVTVPDSWKTVIIAPIYDAHIGSIHHDAKLLKQDLDWIIKTPNVLTFNGGDLIENASKESVGAGVYEQDKTPQEQIDYAKGLMRPIAKAGKMICSLLGNHENRSKVHAGLDVAKWMADDFQVPYFPDYAFVTIKWRKHRFRMVAHHGSGGAASAGGQRNSARKPLPWLGQVDIVWSGHLHSPLSDKVVRVGFDENDAPYRRSCLVLSSPAYLSYGGYAAQKQYAPSDRGLISVELKVSGEIDTVVRSTGRRL